MQTFRFDKEDIEANLLTQDSALDSTTDFDVDLLSIGDVKLMAATEKQPNREFFSAVIQGPKSSPDNGNTFNVYSTGKEYYLLFIFPEVFPLAKIKVEIFCL